MSAKVLVIDRQKWLRGEGFGNSFLLRPSDGKMCCLGFDALACGLQEADIALAAAPCVLMRHDPQLAPEYFQRRMDSPYEHKTAVSIAMETNDDPDLTDAQREAELVPLLKEIGGYDDVQFVN